MQDVLSFLQSTKIAVLLNRLRLNVKFRRLNFILKHFTEDSILEKAEELELQKFAVDGRERYATCSSVAWLSDYHLAAVNLYGQHLRIYKFDQGSASQPPQLKLLHELGEGLSFPENLAASPDGKWLAVTHSMSDAHGISCHSISSNTKQPKPSDKMIRFGRAFHGVAFTRDSRHLVFTEIGHPGYIEVVDTNSHLSTCKISNIYAPLKMKDVVFTEDGQYIIIVLAPNVKRKGEQNESGGRVVIHRFDEEQGIISEEPIVTWNGGRDMLNAVEGCTIKSDKTPDQYTIFAANQAKDCVVAFHFDAIKSTIRLIGIVADDLSFPHGLDMSQNGKFLAVANYGDDTIRIARM